MEAALKTAHAVATVKMTMNNTLSFNEFDLELKEYAKEFHVPIILDEGLSFLELLIHVSKPKKILEIGTAIGYSAMRMARVCGSEVYTIERNPDMYNEAIKNVKKASMEDKVHIIFKDALEAFDEVKYQKFDLIFIDAAKAQYQKFFDIYTPLLSDDGFVVCDNMDFHGLVNDKENYEKQSRAVRGIIRKLSKFHDELLQNPKFDTVVYDIGDGMAVSVQKK